MFKDKCIKSNKYIYGKYTKKTCPCNVYPLKPHIYVYRNNGVCRGIPSFLNFDPKHSSLVLNRNASARRFYCVPTMYVLSENVKQIKDFPTNFLLPRILHGQVFVMRQLHFCTVARTIPIRY